MINSFFSDTLRPTPSFRDLLRHRQPVHRTGNAASISLSHPPLQHALLGNGGYLLTFDYRRQYFQSGEERQELPDSNVSGEWEDDNPSWNVAENPAFTLILDGHLYLSDVANINIQANLKRLLERISLSTVEKGLALIEGGLYNLIIIDKRRNRLIITADQSGSMPLYYLENEDGFHVSGNPFTFANVASVFEFSVIEFLKYGYLPFSNAIFSGVERLLPGQMLQVSLDQPGIHKSNPMVNEFKPLNERISDINLATAALHQAFQSYIYRFEKADYAIGVEDNDFCLLSTAWFRNLAPTLIPMNSDAMGLASDLARISELSAPAAPPEAQEDLLHLELAAHCRLMCSLEHIPLLRRQQLLSQRISGAYLHNFAAASTVGCAHFHNLQYVEGNHLSKINQEAGLNSPIRPIIDYQNFLFMDPHSLGRSDLEGIENPDAESWFLNASRGVLEINRLAGHVHEDFLEALRNYTHSRNIEALYPVAMSRFAPTFCPYVDNEIRQTCDDIDKSIRADNQLLEAYLERYFPDYCELLKRAATNAAKRKKTHQRLMAETRKVLRKTFGWRKKAAGKTAGPSGLLRPDDLRQELDAANKMIPDFVKKTLTKRLDNNEWNEKLMLRFVSLNHFLSAIDK